MDGTTLACIIVAAVLATWFAWQAWELDRDTTRKK
jgi:hypothetical protein